MSTFQGEVHSVFRSFWWIISNINVSVTEYLTVESRWLTWTELMSDCKPADASIITSLRKLPSKDIQNRELQPLVRNFVAQHLDWNSTPSHLYVIKHVAPSKTFQTFSESNWNCVKPAHPTPVGVFHIRGFRNSFCQPSLFYTFLHFCYTSAASGVDFNVSLFVSSWTHTE